MSTEAIYAIPARYRRIENLHILFWLLKDMCWVMLWKPLGIFMILPTLSAAILITWQTRKIKAELLHNLAVDCWISANAYWMVTEFMNRENLRIYTCIPFSIGLLMLLYYYLVVFPLQRRKEKIQTVITIEPKTATH